jgi:bacteriocin biosynthesis cyclodehydratase domain-containing protein
MSSAASSAPAARPAALAAGPVAIISVGGFGKDVATLMAETPDFPVADGIHSLGGDADHAARQVDVAFSSAGTAVVLALWRPFPALCARADELAFQVRRAWLPVVMDHPRVRVGPLVVPGSGACFGCFEARQVQHDRHRVVSAALLAAYDRDSGLAPRGYLGHHARIAAALANVMLGQLTDDPGTAAGHVITSKVFGPGIRRHRVLPCPGCPRCGRSPRPGDSDVLAGLIATIRARRPAVHDARGAKAGDRGDR